MSLPSRRMSRPTPGEGNLVATAPLPRSNQAVTSCIGVDFWFSFDASNESMTQLLTSFGQNLRSVSGLSKRSAPEILASDVEQCPVKPFRRRKLLYRLCEFALMVVVYRLQFTRG